MTCSIIASTAACSSVRNEHSSASSSRRILPRIFPRAMAASACGSRCPAASASSMSRPGTPWMAGDHRRELQVPVFEQFLHPLLLGGAGPGEVPAVPGAGPQPADRLRRHEAGGDHPPLGDPGEPDGVGPVFSELTLPCRKTAHISRSSAVKRCPGRILAGATSSSEEKASKWYDAACPLSGVASSPAMPL